MAATDKDRDFSDAPEAYPLAEGLEVVHDPRGCLPEVRLGQGIERHFPEDLEHEPDQGKELAWGSSVAAKTHEGVLPAQPLWRRQWKRMVFIAIVILVVAIVAGAVGGTLSKRTENGNLLVPPNSSGTPSSLTSSTPSATASGSTSPPLSTSVGSAYSLLNDTAIAATTCANGDRWVFLQDTAGIIRAFQNMALTSDWNKTSISFNFTNALVGTALSASCIDISGVQQGLDTSLTAGQYMSVVYLDQSNALQQSIYTGGSWRNSPVFAASSTPANNTKISTSTQILPASHFTEAKISSVAMYQTSNGSLVAVDISPDENFVANGPSTNPNLFLQYDLQGATGGKLALGSGFACIFNALTPPGNASDLYTRCDIGITNNANNGPVYLRLADISFHYNYSTLANTSERIEFDGSYPLYYNNSFSTDVSLTQLPNNNSAIVYLQPNNTNSLIFSTPGYYASTNEAGIDYDKAGSQTSSPFLLSGQHFCATACSLNSTVVCIYYQTNDTTIAEISYDPVRQQWVSEPKFITM
ncbi:hypothetical protein MMC17_008529 [Xylographa soralifera]|nr:hypothetical protein [Xylographa soralifera]